MSQPSPCPQASATLTPLPLPCLTPHPCFHILLVPLCLKSPSQRASVPGDAKVPTSALQMRFSQAHLFRWVMVWVIQVSPAPFLYPCWSEEQDTPSIPHIEHGCRDRDDTASTGGWTPREPPGLTSSAAQAAVGMAQELGLGSSAQPPPS